MITINQSTRSKAFLYGHAKRVDCVSLSNEAIGVTCHTAHNRQFQLGHVVDNKRRSEIEHDTRQNIPLSVKANVTEEERNINKMNGH